MLRAEHYNNGVNVRIMYNLGENIENLKKEAAEIARRHDLRLAVLYGSVASGQAGPESDIDIAVLGQKPVSFQQLIDLNNDFMNLFPGREIDVKFLHRANPLFRHQVMKNAVLLYGRKRDFDSFKIHAFRDYCESGKLFRLKEALLRKRLAAFSEI